MSEHRISLEITRKLQRDLVSFETQTKLKQKIEEIEASIQSSSESKQYLVSVRYKPDKKSLKFLKRKLD